MFYRHIYSTKNGKYQIIKDNEYYGDFNTLEEALLERDELERLNWDMELICESDIPSENKYLGMSLPPFTHTPKYIQTEVRGRKKRWIIIKHINGKRKRFGRYNSLEEAVHVRDLLLKYDWDKKKVKELLRKK